MEDKYKPEYDMSIHTFRVLCEIAKHLSINNIYTADGIIETNSYDIKTPNGVLTDTTWSNKLLNEYCQAVYQRLPEEKLYWSLNVDCWKSDRTFKVFSIFHESIAVLAICDGQIEVIPDGLTVYKDARALMQGEILGNLDLDCDFFKVGMKCVYTILRGINVNYFYDNPEYTYQQFMIDVRTLANAHNPNV